MRIEHCKIGRSKGGITKTDQSEFNTGEIDRLERGTTKYWAIRQLNVKLGNQNKTPSKLFKLFTRIVAAF